MAGMTGSFGFYLLLSISAIFMHFVLTNAQSDPISNSCGSTGNYPSNSQYNTNLNTLLSSLSSSNATFNNNFLNATAGENSDKVYGLVLCRGDALLDDCRRCANDSSQEIKKRCPYQKQAIIGYGNCMLRYSNQSIFSKLEQDLIVYMWDPNNVSDVDLDEFNQVLGDLTDGLVRRAAFGPSSIRMFARGYKNITAFQKIYGMVQCIPYLFPRDCNICLQGARAEILNHGYGKPGGRAIKPSCNLRYEIFPFFDTSGDALAPFPSTTNTSGDSLALFPSTTNTTISNGSEGNKSSRTQTVRIIIMITFFMVGLISAICSFSRRRKAKDEPKDVVHVDEISTVESLQMEFGTLKTATNSFSDANKLGVGGFGAVYMGRLPNGQKIAVKRLSRNSGQGDLEFKNEVLLVAKLQHRNLVRLLGFCLEGEEKLLIYEFVENASLDHFIFDPIRRAQLNWEKRYKIIGGITRGLLYLHEDSRLRIIHRDLKASNILLDEDMNPKISDFGMAKHLVLDQTQGNTNRIAGTFGYMAPEYVKHGDFSTKSDIFSFGVLLLEIVTGKKNNCFQSEHAEDLLSYAWRQWREGNALELMDSVFGGSCSVAEVLRCIHIGLLCVQDSKADRPTMASIILALTSNFVTLPRPLHPAFFLHSRMGSSMPSAEYGSQENEYGNPTNQSASLNELSITEMSSR